MLTDVVIKIEIFFVVAHRCWHTNQFSRRTIATDRQALTTHSNHHHYPHVLLWAYVLGCSKYLWRGVNPPLACLWHRGNSRRLEACHPKKRRKYDNPRPASRLGPCIVPVPKGGTTTPTNRRTSPSVVSRRHHATQPIRGGYAICLDIAHEKHPHRTVWYDRWGWWIMIYRYITVPYRLDRYMVQLFRFLSRKIIRNMLSA